jgi:signal peptide peptidase SppA
MKSLHILREVLETPWAILPDTLASLQAIVARHVAGVRLSAEEIATVTAGAPRPTARTPGAVAVIPIYGPISQRPVKSLSAGETVATTEIAKALRAAVADPTVKAIVLDIHSPGGSVFGVPELGAEIAKAREQKHITAVANSLAASAAYWLASQASEVVVTPGGQIGSIGVYTAHVDLSKAEEMEGVKTTLISAGKYKVEDSPYGPLSDEARAAIQERVDAYYDQFVRAVAKGRGTTPAAVRSGYGEGRVVGAEAAVRAGLADRIATLDEVLAKLGAAVPVGEARAEDEAPEVTAAVEPEPQHAPEPQRPTWGNEARRLKLKV